MSSDMMPLHAGNGKGREIHSRSERQIQKVDAKACVFLRLFRSKLRQNHAENTFNHSQTAHEKIKSKRNTMAVDIAGERGRAD